MRLLLFPIVLLGTLGYGQLGLDSVLLSTNGVALRSMGRRFSELSARSRLEVDRLKLRGYREFIVEGENMKQLMGSDDHGRPRYYTTLNVGLGRMIKADKLHQGGGLGLNISGEGLSVGQWDFSKPRLGHELLLGKVVYGSDQNQMLSRHSTHISGTIGGRSGVHSEATGVAYGAEVRAYDWVNSSEEMSREASMGLLVANNSYGFDPLYLQAYEFGKYNTTSKSWDGIMYHAPYFQIVKAAGNARGIELGLLPHLSRKGGYDLLEGGGVGKNVLVVTSVNSNQTMMSDGDFMISKFSSYGPTDDGRIKPDLSAQGEGVYSSIDTHNRAYALYDGTSSASAGVSAAILLLQQFHHSLKGRYMWSSTVRGLLSHTANDRGALGPDYIYGWGLMDADRAAKLLHNDQKNTLVKELELSQGGSYKLYVAASKYERQPLVATLAWTDPEGNLSTNVEDVSDPVLVNNLDLKIVQSNDSGTQATTYYPWTLSGVSATSKEARRDRENQVDNIEKVEVDHPDGMYQIVVSHKNMLQGGKQKYSLIISGVAFCYTDDLVVLTRERDNVDFADEATQVRGVNLKASNVVQQNSEVSYRATNSILLLPDASASGSKTLGFFTEPNAKFLALIDPSCEISDAHWVYHAQSGRSGDSLYNPLSFSSMKSSSVYLFPNPASEEVRVKFKINESSPVTISLHDISGRRVYSQTSTQDFPMGDYIKSLELKGFPSGVYILSVETKEFKETKKLIIK